MPGSARISALSIRRPGGLLGFFLRFDNGRWSRGVGLLYAGFAGLLAVLIVPGARSVPDRSAPARLSAQTAQAQIAQAAPALLAPAKPAPAPEPTAPAAGAFGLRVTASGRPLAPPRPRETQPHEAIVALGAGDSLSHLLDRAGIEARDIFLVSSALKPHFDPRGMQVGQKVYLSFAAMDADVNRAAERILAGLHIHVPGGRELRLKRGVRGKFSARMRERELDSRYFRSGGRIDSSFFHSARRAGIPAAILIKAIRIYSHALDFQREVHPGDRFDIVYTRRYDAQGNYAAAGEILRASLTTESGRRSHVVWRYAPRGGAGEYFDATGRSIQGFFMKTPVDGARLSSTFGMRRHPILGYSRMHRGVDFAAPSGTPVYAAGHGEVEEIGRKGGYGNYILLRHARGYKTAYAHLLGFARGLKKGRRVGQGEVIGYVGSSGLSTGPHLHYEILHRGKQVNPTRVKLPPARVLSGDQMADFRDVQAELDRIAELLSPDREEAGRGQTFAQKASGGAAGH